MPHAFNYLNKGVNDDKHHRFGEVWVPLPEKILLQIRKDILAILVSKVPILHPCQSFPTDILILG